MPYAEIETETSYRNVISAVAAALRPGAVITLPIGGAILLPGSVFLPSALRMPAGLLLPSLRLLIAALGRTVAALTSGRIGCPFWLLLLGVLVLLPLLLRPSRRCWAR